MSDIDFSIQNVEKTVPLRSLSISIEDIKKIYERLRVCVAEEADREVAKLAKPDGKSDEEFNQIKRDIKERAFRISVTIRGTNGEALYGDTVRIFDSPNLPEKISLIFLTNINAYKSAVGSDPVSRFSLYFDFSKPPLLDSQNPISGPTPNVSNLSIHSNRDPWVASVSEAVTQVLLNRKKYRAWLHAAFVYDIGLLAIGLPVGLYACSKLSSLVAKLLPTTNSFFSVTAYIYITLSMIWLYRIFFGYTKWAFPTVELDSARDTAKKHRNFWYLVVSGILVNILWEIFH